MALVIGYFTGQAQWKNEMAGLRSDVRDGFTMMIGDRKADGVRIDVIRRDLDDLMRQNKLQDIKIQDRLYRLEALVLLAFKRVFTLATRQVDGKLLVKHRLH